ncbi:uncharacterized protein M437DRAFT_66425 [Aureobasidium melanogenum CBS 110374]|uniref:Uncharacterized protein n=1 Tax=Aureobasidium melanogenum (strain CBS 110374) TaxID=1043003 RepID=A0A074WJH2_AURM1|nr:uncharacterized protein M437DRAFT_66425 [Aureobasidium melanogenum CBS 110374]KEQ62571.1 hypothetical protein M437DRAFT_66425 [Aureobasidium melanogenum CBS 110374]
MYETISIDRGLEADEAVGCDWPISTTDKGRRELAGSQALIAVYRQYTNSRGEVGKYGNGLGSRTKQKLNMHPKEFNSASQMVKYFYDERFYDKPLIRQGMFQIHFFPSESCGYLCAQR